MPRTSRAGVKKRGDFAVVRKALRSRRYLSLAADFERAVTVFDRFNVKAPEFQHQVVVAGQHGNRDRQTHDRRDECRPDAGGMSIFIFLSD